MALTVKQYIEGNLKRGKKWEELRNNLLAVGHKEEAVDNIYHGIIRHRNKKRLMYGIMFAIVIVIGIFAYPYVGTLWNDVAEADGEPMANDKADEIATDDGVQENPSDEAINERLSDNDHFDLAVGNRDPMHCHDIADEKLRGDCLVLVK